MSIEIVQENKVMGPAFYCVVIGDRPDFLYSNDQNEVSSFLRGHRYSDIKIYSNNAVLAIDTLSIWGK